MPVKQKRKQNIKRNSSVMLMLISAFTFGALFMDDLRQKQEILEVMDENQVRLCFTPTMPCRKHIINAINSAELEILVQAYSFTEPEIAESLVNAHARGVNVQVILDESQKKSKGSKIKKMVQNEIDIFIDNKVTLAHNKVIIIDESITITGSYNFSKAAEKRNAENLLIISNKNIAKSYRDNWILRKNLSTQHLIANSA